jgi:hypothetical protein
LQIQPLFLCSCNFGKAVLRPLTLGKLQGELRKKIMTKFAKRLKAMWLCAFLFLGLPAVSFAGGSTCAAATALVPDGRVLTLDYVQAGAPGQPATVWYSFLASSGHSYSVEVRDDLDGNPNGDLAFTFYSASCATQMSGAAGPSYTPSQYRDTSAIEPAVVPNTGLRVSIPNPNNDTIAIKVANSSLSSGHYVSVSVTETTLYDPSVITNGNMNNFYSIQNTTSATINGTFTFRETWTGALIAPSPITISLIANTAAAVNTATPAPGTNPPGYLALTRGKYGSAAFANDGPPGALAVNAAIADFTMTPAYVQATRLAPVRQGAH